VLLNKNVPRIQIDLLSRLRSEQLYLGTGALPSPPQMSTQPDAETVLPVEPDPTEKPSAGSRAPKPPRAKQGIINTEAQESSDLRRFVAAWLGQEPFLTQGAIFQRLGITSGSAQSKIKHELGARNLLVDHKLRVGKCVVSVWEATDAAFDLVGFERPTYHSKGGYLHQFVAYHMAQCAKQNGFSAEIEFFLTNGKSVDVVLRREREVHFVEIAMSDPMEKEISNIIKDLETDLQPDKLIVAARDRGMKVTLQRMISSDERLKDHRHKLEIVLAGDFVRKR